MENKVLKFAFINHKLFVVERKVDGTKFITYLASCRTRQQSCLHEIMLLPASCTDPHTYTCAHTQTLTHIPVHTHTHKPSHINLCTRTHARTHTNPHSCTDPHTYTCANTHTHDRPLRRSVNLSRRQHLRNALFDALHQLSGTHYRKLFSVVTLLQFLSLG